MPSKISFSIIDILDPKKFNSRRLDELSVAKEKFPAQRADLLEFDRTAGEDVESAGAGGSNLIFTRFSVCDSPFWLPI